MTKRLHSLLLAGATGLVGHEVLRQAAALDGMRTVHALARRLPAARAPDPRIAWMTVDFGALPPLPRCDAALCALGTTIKAAGSQAAFRAVDHDAVLAFARAAHRAGVRRLAVVSALGADPRSAVFYNRVKGETEAALRAIGFATLVIARPSLLAGDRAALGQSVRAGERWALALTRPVAALIPKAWRPIEAAVLARAMLRELATAGPGEHRLESAQLQDLGAA